MERIIIHSDLNNFYASVERKLNPSLSGKPVAVCGNREERHGIVLAKSEEAKKCGIKTGDTVWQAQKVQRSGNRSPAVRAVYRIFEKGACGLRKIYRFD